MSEARCPSCSAEFQAPVGIAGAVLRCPACGEQFALGQADPDASAPLGVPPDGGPAPAAAAGYDPLAAYRGDTVMVPPPGHAAVAPGPEDETRAFREADLPAQEAGEPPAYPDAQAAGLPEQAAEPEVEPADAAPITPTPTPAGEAGEAFGPFDLLGKTGSSDIAMSYRARDRARDIVVSLKILAPGKYATREEVAVLVERARSARGLEHGNIAKVLEVGRSDELDYVAAEYVEGRTLAGVMEAEGLPVARSVEIVRDLANALDYAHGLGVEHGNVSPASIVLDAEGTPHLVDFGLARELWRLSPEDLRSVTPSDLPLPWHMSPEQLGGGEATARSDVYGLGAVLYRMLTGVPPFPGRSLLGVVLEVDRGGPAPPATLNDRVPPAVNAVVMKCLDREPADRFRTAGEVALELDRSLRGERVKATAAGPARRLLRELARRWKQAAAVVALGAAAGLASYVVARSGALGGSAARAEAEITGALDAVRSGASGQGGEGVERLARVASDEGLPARLRARAAACLGWAHLRGGRPAEAAGAFSRAVGFRPGDAELHYFYAVALWHGNGDPAEVVAELRASVRLDPQRAQSPRYQYELGRACERAGLDAEARAAFEEVRRLDPGYQAALVGARLGGASRSVP